MPLLVLRYLHSRFHLLLVVCLTMGERKNSSSFFMIFILIIPFGSFFVTHTLCCYCVLWVLFLLSTQRRMRIFKPGKQTRQTLTRTREEKGFSFSNLLLLQGPKKTEFRGNSSSWGCCIRVIEKSHIFQQGSFHEIATKEQYSSNLKLSLKLCYILNMNTQKYNEHFFR